MPLGVPANVLGLIVKGDVADITIYTDRYGRKVAYKKSPPKKAPSALQTVQRARFAEAVTNWKALSTDVKTLWENISLRTSLYMTGHNLWIHVSLQSATLLLATLQRQSGITVDDPPLIPWPDA